LGDVAVLKTYVREYEYKEARPHEHDDDVDYAVSVPKPWPFCVINEDGNKKATKSIKPGDWVAHWPYEGQGMVVAVDDNSITVLWSVPPRTYVRSTS
jgi:hypothetical protein